MKSDLLRLQALCRVPLDLVFFGHRCTLWLIEDDCDDAHFFYRHHLRQDGAAAETHVLLYSESGFYRSLLAKDHARKTMIGLPAKRNEPMFHHDFLDWSGAPSVLPPFFSSALKERFTVTPGAVVTPGTSDQGWLIRGANYAGKSSLAMALIRLGFGLVSDHLVIRERQSGTCMGYHSPIGLRRRNYLEFKARSDLDRVTYRETISADTGPVALVHAEDIMQVTRLDYCMPLLELTLLRDPLRNALELEQADRNSNGELTCYTVHVPNHMPPDAIAETLTRALS
ncbi:MAG: hypothetical protein ABJN14_12320 [Paracoccaceae bacterium]